MFRRESGLRVARVQLTQSQWWNGLFVVGACIAYLGLVFTAPRAGNGSSSNFPLFLIIILGLSIIGLLLFTWLCGYYAWLQLNTYARRLSSKLGQQAFDQISQGVRFLAVGLILSSFLSAARPFYASDIGLTAVMAQVNYYIIIVFPFLGFLWLWMGSRHLAVSTQAVMSIKSKLVTIGPPVLVLAAFYIFLVVTNSTPATQILLAGPLGFLVLPLNIFLVVGSWVLGLLAALNIERSTHLEATVLQARPLTRLYNGILTTTGGFIILDALMSLGAERLRALPVGITVALIYLFIGVVALGFMMVATGARQLVATAPAKTDN